MKRISAAMLSAILVVISFSPSSHAEQHLFESHDVITLKLTSNFTALFEDPKGVREYFPARLEHLKADGSTDSLDLRIRLRGNFRTASKNCSFPPIRLNLQKESAKGTIFEGQKILKLVTHCKVGRNYEQFVLQEYLTYRIWNEVTDHSFKVRLVQMTYVEGPDSTLIATRYGFLIEHKDSLGLRLGATPAKTPRAKTSELDTNLLAGMSLFQFLIGNTDWSTIRGPDPEECCHNIELLKTANGKYLPIPYDFDQASLVNASYSRPSEEMQLRSTRVRLYRGFCLSNSELDHWVSAFSAARNDIYGLFDEGVTALSERRRAQSIKYLDTFYQTIGSSSALKRQILSKCRG